MGIEKNLQDLIDRGEISRRDAEKILESLIRDASALNSCVTSNDTESDADTQEAIKISGTTFKQDRIKKTTEDNTTYDLMLTQGLEWTHCTGDGHCFYRAVALALGREGVRGFFDDDTINLPGVLQLRRRVANYIINHPEIVTPFLITDGKTKEEIDNDIKTLTDRIANTNRDATGIEIAVLMNVLDRPIYVIGEDRTNNHAVLVNGGQEHFRGHPIIVHYNNGGYYDEYGHYKELGHYNALNPIDRTNIAQLLAQIPRTTSSPSSSSSSSSTSPELIFNPQTPKRPRGDNADTSTSAKKPKTNKKYDDLTTQEQIDFKKIVKNKYYGLLGLDDQIMEEIEKNYRNILQQLWNYHIETITIKDYIFLDDDLVENIAIVRDNLRHRHPQNQSCKFNKM